MAAIFLIAIAVAVFIYIACAIRDRMSRPSMKSILLQQWEDEEYHRTHELPSVHQRRAFEEYREKVRKHRERAQG